jgi:lipopolysaccharide transport system ATP-binding protein
VSAIVVENLGKRYTIGRRQAQYRTLRDSLVEGASDAWGRLTRRNGTAEGPETLWALKDVSFEVQPGEVVGIIGRNGAGKSTLLKVLSRITKPTTGRVRLRGRVASLLEVGTGFHAELTGRENVYLNGAILGMTRAEMDRKFDEIVAFAEVEQFIDTPVKRYSSGMYLRLAFAVAAHLEPEILVVDEVLAVGDAQFQQKCLGKMETVSASGRTVLFVSHSMSAITRICSAAVLLQQGQVLATGTPQGVVSRYLASTDAPGPRRAFASQGLPVELIEAAVEDATGQVNDELRINENFSIRIRYRAKDASQPVDAQLALYTDTGTLVFMSCDHMQQRSAGQPRGEGDWVCRVTIPANLLAEGTYSARIVLWDTLRRGVVYAKEHNALSFSIRDPADGSTVRGHWTAEWPGIIRPDLSWTSTRLGPSVGGTSAQWQ